jgi:pimeloyl-ACP methyl ester carboxylesterase
VPILLIVVVALVLAALGVAGLVYLAPGAALRCLIAVERSRAGLARKALTLPGGLSYIYLEGGAGEPLMLLHGFGADKDHFNRAARFLTRHYRVIVPDHIGFGESAHPMDADYAPTAQAARLRLLAQQLGIATLHLGGSSMGGQIAMTYAALYPQELRSLWLIDPAGIWTAPPSELRKLLNDTGRNALMARNEDEFAQILGFVVRDPPLIPRPMLDVLAQPRIRNFALEQRIFHAIDADSIESRIAGMSVPTLIVWGEHDRVISVATAEMLHKLLPQSQVILMPRTGHLPILERPSRCAEDYLRFRRTLLEAAEPSPT